MTYLNFHRPGKYAGRERRGFIASVILTKTRWLVLNSSNPVINVPLADERLRRMRCSLEGAETLHVAFDANLFQPEWSGAVEYRFRTSEAQGFLKLLPR